MLVYVMLYIGHALVIHDWLYMSTVAAYGLVCIGLVKVVVHKVIVCN